MTKKTTKPDFVRGAEKASKLVDGWPLWKQEAGVIGLRDSIMLDSAKDSREERRQQHPGEREMRKTCDTCAHEDLLAIIDGPCEWCDMDYSEWVSKAEPAAEPTVETEPPKAPHCSSCAHYTGDTRNWPCCDYYSSDCWTPKPDLGDVFEECATCVHEYLEGGEEPCRSCFNAEHLTPKPDSEDIPVKTEGRENVAPQPPPAPNSSTPIWDLVIEDMRARDLDGRHKYGTPLQAGNGRDALVDAYQEALDLVVYLRQAIEERDEKKLQYLRPRRSRSERGAVPQLLCSRR